MFLIKLLLLLFFSFGVYKFFQTIDWRQNVKTRLLFKIQIVSLLITLFALLLLYSDPYLAMILVYPGAFIYLVCQIAHIISSLFINRNKTDNIFLASSVFLFILNAYFLVFNINHL